MTFIPNSPATMIYAIALAAACALAIWRDRSLYPVVLVMLVNWLATRFVSAFEMPGSVQAVADITSAAVLLAMRHLGSMAVLPVAALFGLMVIFACLHDLKLITRDTMWAWADVAAYCQLIIIAGVASAGGGRSRLVMALHRRRRAPAMVCAVAARLQAPPPP